jgi:hypothetical protein
MSMSSSVSFLGVMCSLVDKARFPFPFFIPPTSMYSGLGVGSSASDVESESAAFESEVSVPPYSSISSAPLSSIGGHSGKDERLLL